MQSQSTQQPATKEPKINEPEINDSEISEPEIIPEHTIAAEPRQAFGPQFPGFELSETRRNCEGELLEDLLSGMRPFMEVQPVTVGRMVSNNPAAPNAASAVPSLAVNVPAGRITGIKLDSTIARPQQHIVVQWNTGHEFWRDAQVDVLRSNTKEGPWVPIAINLSNGGEYWWFLTPEDLKPFYVAVRIRSVEGGIQMDVTKSVITIDPRLSQFPKPHS